MTLFRYSKWSHERKSRYMYIYIYVCILKVRKKSMPSQFKKSTNKCCAKIEQVLKNSKVLTSGNTLAETKYNPCKIFSRGN